MPVYEYLCRDCSHKFDLVESISEHDPEKISCPKCKSQNAERVWGAVNVVTSKKS